MVNMASAKIDPNARANAAKKTRALKVAKAKKPIVNDKGQSFTRDEAAKNAFKAKMPK